MRYRIDTDPFESQQPKVEFMENLSGPVHTHKPSVWNMREATEKEVFITSLKICADFPDSEAVLKAAYEDFEKFLEISGCCEGDDFVFRTVHSRVMAEESYRITVSENECLIESADTEGIRRALFYIEDEMHRREGTFLPFGVIFRYAVIKRRISRGFLNPHYCPGCEGELEDDTEYYTDDYLNRLAHDGVNGLWVQERLRVIVPSDIIPEYGRNGKQRVERLNRLIQRCKRYGIKVYLEGIEPASTLQNPELKNHPDLFGQSFGDEYTFCASTEKGKKYIEESITRLFEMLPDLAGIINISVGEAISNCASLDTPLTCPHCLALGLDKAQVLANCEREISLAMRRVKPQAEHISWAYGMRMWKEEDMKKYFDIRSSKAVSMINFEDLGEAQQLGKIRTAMDYWLSYTGPGKIFRKAAETGKKRNTPVYAKLQVCSSHEVSTVPYVPVPGILYDKYKYMHENNVSGAMYCWYFGNFPSMMNKAAGELAFAPFFTSKDKFLKHLGGIYWGKDCEKAAEAYNLFEKGYSNYPVSMTFEWHGPMGDAPVWPLHLEPVDLPISRSYKLMNMVGSDRIGEAMLMGHTHEEILELCRRMSDNWAKGEAMLSELDGRGDYRRKEQQYVASALAVLFNSGTNIIRFYDLRNKLAFSGKNEGEILEKMRQIVIAEIENSTRLISLCEKDKRLGYHCEAMGFKFFPEKLHWRIGLLKEMLENEFKVVEERINKKRLPLPFCYGLAEESHRYVTEAEKIEDAPWETFAEDPQTAIRIAETEKSFVVQIRKEAYTDILIKPEMKMFHPYVNMKISREGLSFEESHGYGLFDEKEAVELSKWKVECEENICTVTFDKKSFWENKPEVFRLDVSVDGKHWEKGDRFYYRLIFGNFSPDSYVFIIPRGKEALK